MMWGDIEAPGRHWDLEPWKMKWSPGGGHGASEGTRDPGGGYGVLNGNLGTLTHAQAPVMENRCARDHYITKLAPGRFVVIKILGDLNKID